MSRIDHLLITHFHVDHVGGVPNLVSRVQVGEFLDHGPNRAAEKKWPADPSENARSSGILLRFGRLSFLDLGDLTGAKEVALMCPNNPIGTVDLFLVSHHGMDWPNSHALVDAIHPLAAIMNNGAHKAGMPVLGRRCIPARDWNPCGSSTLPKISDRRTARRSSLPIPWAMETGRTSTWSHWKTAAFP